MENPAQVYVEFEDTDSLDIASRLKVAEDDEDVKDNWDDESEDEEEKAKVAESAPSATTTQPKPKKRSAKEVAAEKEALKKQEQEEMRRQVEALANMTPEEAAAEKRRIQKEQEDQDFALGADTFLEPDEVATAKGAIDSFEPYSLETFNKFRTLLTEKIGRYHKSDYYSTFLNSFFQDLSLYLPAEDVRRIGATLTTLAGEKAKIEKEKAGKGKPKATKKPGIGSKKMDDSKANLEADYDPVDDMF